PGTSTAAIHEQGCCRSHHQDVRFQTGQNPHPELEHRPASIDQMHRGASTGPSQHVGNGRHELSRAGSTRWSPNALPTYKSATLPPQDHRQTIKGDEMFQDFLKLLSAGSIKRLRNDSVDLQPILYGPLAMGNNHAMNMTDLIAKTCFFLAICELMRADD
ncbi:hypothetical protein DFQ27_009839, partial [Actinomortierella ambigua]